MSVHMVASCATYEQQEKAHLAILWPGAAALWTQGVGSACRSAWFASIKVPKTRQRQGDICLGGRCSPARPCTRRAGSMNRIHRGPSQPGAVLARAAQAACTADSSAARASAHDKMRRTARSTARVCAQIKKRRRAGTPHEPHGRHGSGGTGLCCAALRCAVLQPNAPPGVRVGIAKRRRAAEKERGST